jgi:very-short-patch-repair endonuclease
MSRWYVYKTLIDDFNTNFESYEHGLDSWPIDRLPAVVIQGLRETDSEWNEHVSAGPFRLWLPHPEDLCMVPFYIWKISNNGTTYVASPFQLHYLGGACGRPDVFPSLPASASPIEQKFFDAWCNESEIDLDFQHKVLNYRIDFCYVPEKIAIELDGMVGHSSPSDIEKDRRRQREIETLGYTFVRFGGREVSHDARKCVLEVLRRIQSS